MPRGIVYVTGDGEIPEEFAALDGESFEIMAVSGTDRGVEVPLPEDTDCVVIDHDPPEIDGLAATALIRERYLDLPIVLYPSASSESLAAAAVNVDVDAYVRPNGEATSVFFGPNSSD